MPYPDYEWGILPRNVEIEVLGDGLNEVCKYCIQHQYNGYKGNDRGCGLPSDFHLIDFPCTKALVGAKAPLYYEYCPFCLEHLMYMEQSKQQEKEWLFAWSDTIADGYDFFDENSSTHELFAEEAANIDAYPDINSAPEFRDTCQLLSADLERIVEGSLQSGKIITAILHYSIDRPRPKTALEHIEYSLFPSGILTWVIEFFPNGEIHPMKICCVYDCCDDDTACVFRANLQFKKVIKGNVVNRICKICIENGEYDDPEHPTAIDHMTECMQKIQGQPCEPCRDCKFVLEHLLDDELRRNRKDVHLYA